MGTKGIDKKGRYDKGPGYRVQGYAQSASRTCINMMLCDSVQ